MAAQRPDDPIQWVADRLGSADDEIAAITLSHYEPHATLKADIQALKVQIEALTDIVGMLAIEVDALRNHNAP